VTIQVAVFDVHPLVPGDLAEECQRETQARVPGLPGFRRARNDAWVDEYRGREALEVDQPNLLADLWSSYPAAVGGAFLPGAPICTVARIGIELLSGDLLPRSGALVGAHVAGKLEHGTAHLLYSFNNSARG